METKPTVQFDDFSKLDLRIATVTQAEAHPNADKLLKLQVDLGDEQRQVCAGLKPYIDDPATLVGKQIVVVANLAPRKIRGEQSNGMLLAATVNQPNAETGEAELSDVVPLAPGKGVPAGAAVS